MPRRPLGVLTEVIDEIGLKVTYAYEDLVFIEHNPFLFQFDDKTASINLFFNQDCPSDEAAALEEKIVSLGAERELTINRKGRYVLEQLPSDEIRLRFLDE